MRSLTVISTFAGCGGSSAGYEAAGCKVLACVEWDKHACECYRLNHPSTLVLQRDIATVTGVELLDAIGLGFGELDILDGSPPCQGFSASGRRVFDDSRNSLFRQHLRLVDEIGPRNVIIENVAGIVKGKMRTIAGEIVKSLKDRGYQVAAGIIDAQYFGVPQRRVRTIFVGSKLGQPALPRPTSRPIPCGMALAGVTPDEMLWPTNAGQRLMASKLRPGDKGSDVLKREGRKTGWFDVSMLDPAAVSPTLHKHDRGRTTLYHWTRRHVSIREALVLAGFPPDYILPGSFHERWARIGNAVAPPMAREIARQSIMPLYGATITE